MITISLLFPQRSELAELFSHSSTPQQLSVPSPSFQPKLRGHYELLEIPFAALHSLHALHLSWSLSPFSCSTAPLTAPAALFFHPSLISLIYGFLQLLSLTARNFLPESTLIGRSGLYVLLFKSFTNHLQTSCSKPNNNSSVLRFYLITNFLSCQLLSRNFHTVFIFLI